MIDPEKLEGRRPAAPSGLKAPARLAQLRVADVITDEESPPRRRGCSTRSDRSLERYC